MAIVGALAITASVLLFWSLYPRGGKEARIMQIPGTWIVMPLLIMLCLLVGGAAVHTYLFR